MLYYTSSQPCRNFMPALAPFFSGQLAALVMTPRPATSIPPHVNVLGSVWQHKHSFKFCLDCQLGCRKLIYNPSSSTDDVTDVLSSQALEEATIHRAPSIRQGFTRDVSLVVALLI
jgi:hypothetical protein